MAHRESAFQRRFITGSGSNSIDPYSKAASSMAGTSSRLNFGATFADYFHVLKILQVYSNSGSFILGCLLPSQGLFLAESVGGIRINDVGLT